MGAAQSFQWAAQYPDFMDLIVPFCGSAKTSLHNQVFLEGVKSALLSAKRFKSSGSGEIGVALDGGPYRPWTQEEKEAGLKAFGRVYAGWYIVLIEQRRSLETNFLLYRFRGLSQAFYRDKLYEKVLGYKDLEDFMVRFWENIFIRKGGKWLA